MTPRLRIMLESRQLEEGAAVAGEVEGLWRKAGQTLASSAVAGLDPNARFTLVYQAALQGAMAISRAAGYRVRGDAHHHDTFAAVAALEAGDLSDAAREVNVIRRKRHGAVYDWDTQLTEQHVEELRAEVRRLFAYAEPWLRARHPDIHPLPTHLA